MTLSAGIKYAIVCALDRASIDLAYYLAYNWQIHWKEA